MTHLNNPLKQIFREYFILLFFSCFSFIYIYCQSSHPTRYYAYHPLAPKFCTSGSSLFGMMVSLILKISISCFQLAISRASTAWYLFVGPSSRLPSSPSSRSSFNALVNAQYMQGKYEQTKIWYASTV